MISIWTIAELLFTLQYHFYGRQIILNLLNCIFVKPEVFGNREVNGHTDDNNKTSRKGISYTNNNNNNNNK